MGKRRFTEAEAEILDTVATAYMEDPSPESGRTYYKGEELFDAACKLEASGLLRVIEKGADWAHFGLTDKGFKAAEAL